MAGDPSQYGLINVVTRASRDMDDYDRATDLERLRRTVRDLAMFLALQEPIDTSEAVPVANKIIRIGA